MEVTFTIDADGSVKNPKSVGQWFRDHAPGTYTANSKLIKIRSIQQNRFWWGYLLPTVRQGLINAGFDEVKTDHDCHEVLKALFFKKQIVNHTTGEVIEIAGSTADATTFQFSEKIAEIQKWGSEYLGIIILDPGQRLEIDF